MTTDLAAALRACATGLLPLEAGVALLTSRFITIGTSIGDGTTPMAAIDWHAAITALNSGGLLIRRGTAHTPAVGQPRRRIPVDLRDTITGIDNDNTALLITAIRHAAGDSTWTSLI